MSHDWRLYLDDVVAYAEDVVWDVLVRDLPALRDAAVAIQRSAGLTS